VDYQIILLPRKRYWSWVRACRDYVLRFGPNLTSDPVSAAHYMAPGQVITFPIVPEGYAELGDIQRWFQDHHAGIRLDPIEVTKPFQLRAVLRERVKTEDRYGQKGKEFYLIWPTDYPVITQAFRVNPQIYSRWGFPGHEGIDFRARPNTNIYACADGEVYRVHTNPQNHPYGIHIRIRHKDGYKTVYAHSAESLVSEGQIVEAGQVIAKADATGASTGSHLHLTLKRDGATERGETDYPKDVIDPTPYLIWPEAGMSKMYTRSEWAPSKCLVGVHGRVGGDFSEIDFDIVSLARVEAVKLEMGVSKKTVERLRKINPALFLTLRLSAEFSGGAVSVDDFLSRVKSEVGRLYRLGVRFFEVISSPNLQVGGWNRSWQTGWEFSTWFMKVVSQLRQEFPEGRFGFPGLSPGRSMSGWRADADQFLSEAEEAVEFSDWVGVQCYWRDKTGMKSLEDGKRYEIYRRRFPAKLLFITEFQNTSTRVEPTIKGQEYLDYYRMLRGFPGLGAAFAYAISAAESHHANVWRSEDGSINEIPQIVGQLEFDP
jgi:hypothetical protein